jgi:hypothetical protein
MVKILKARGLRGGQLCIKFEGFLGKWENGYFTEKSTHGGKVDGKLGK